MLRIIHIKNDLRQIMRDPVMAAMMLAPLLTIVVFKLLIVFLIPFIQAQTGFDISVFYEYVLAFVLLINTGLLGIVTGFLMIDDRDGNILALMSVTPLGKGGYLVNRLMFASALSLVYSILGYYVLNLVELPFLTLMIIAILSAIYAAIIGLLLFLGADDKVKGLTYAKALNIFVLFVFVDLFPLSWLSYVAWFFPTYWIAAIIKSPNTFLDSGLAIIVHVIWLLILIYRSLYQKNTARFRPVVQLEKYFINK